MIPDPNIDDVPPATAAEIETLPQSPAADAVAISPPRPRVWTVFCVFVLAMVLYVVASAICMVVAAVITYDGAIATPKDFERMMAESLETPQPILAGILGSGVVLLGISIFAAALSPVPLMKRLNLHRPAITPLGLLIAIFGTLSVGIALWGLDGLNLVPDSPALGAITDVIAALEGPWLAVGLLLIGVLPGIDEELLFRGYAQTRLVQRWGVHAGVWISALLFGLMHMDFVQGGFAVVLGAYLGYLTVWCGSIVPAMICHAVNNMISVVLTKFTPALELDSGVPSSIGLILAGVTVLSGSMWFLRNYGTRPALHEQAIA